jgi:hypothetical protein
MKATIKQQDEKPSFKPFTLTIEVEKLEEARELWHRFNPRDISIPFPIDKNIHPYTALLCLEPFDAIDNQIKPYENTH